MARRQDEEGSENRFRVLIDEPQLRAEAEAEVKMLAVGITDTRRLELLIRNSRVQLALMRVIELEPSDKHLTSAWRTAEAIFNGIEQQARLLGLKLNTAVDPEQLDTASSILKAIQAFTLKIVKAKTQLRENDPAEYSTLTRYLKQAEDEHNGAGKEGAVPEVRGSEEAEAEATGRI